MGNERNSLRSDSVHFLSIFRVAKLAAPQRKFKVKSNGNVNVNVNVNVKSNVKSNRNAKSKVKTDVSAMLRRGE
jgi:hypothetical protein